MTSRRQEIEHKLSAVRERVARACERVGRTPSSVQILAVTKTFPPQDLELLAELGCTDVGESRDQEARSKRQQLAVPLRWHMIGQIQRNKVRQIAAWADVVESVDRIEIADALSTAAVQIDKELEVLVQLSLDDEDGGQRGGVRPRDLMELAARVTQLPHLSLGGLMAVAPREGGADAAFAQLEIAHAQVLSIAPGATTLSAGMSGDLEAAIAHGATQVRIGGALLGNRPPLK